MAGEDLARDATRQQMMTLSEHKGGLAACAAVTGLGALLALALSIRLLFGGPVSPAFEQTTFALGMLAIVSALVAVLLLTEHTRATQAAPRGRTSDAAQIRSATRHCPVPVKIACLVGAVLATLQGLAIGEASWTSGQTLATGELRGFAAVALFFLSISLPVIASAARMEGAYGE